jgi:hypothetical protein
VYARGVVDVVFVRNGGETKQLRVVNQNGGCKKAHTHTMGRVEEVKGRERSSFCGRISESSVLHFFFFLRDSPHALPHFSSQLKTP